MAYYNQNQSKQSSGALGMNQEEEQQQQQGAAPVGAPVQLSTASANNVDAAAGLPTAPKQASSGMAPGFQSYTKANQGMATNKLTNAAQSNVQNLGQQAQTSINQATNKFGQKVDAGSLANRHQAIQDVANAVNAARNITAAPRPQNTGITAQAGVATPAATNGTMNSNKGAAATPATPATPAAPNALGGMDQSQVNRFQEVINAKYQGPESLRQSGLFNPAAQKVAAANTATQNAGTAQGREELLRQMYEKRGDYTRGLNKLDTAILNSSKTGVQNLQSTAEQFKNVSNDLTKAQINSSNLAQNRTQEIKDIQNQARTKFTEGKTAEEAATEDRLANVVKDWDKLPEHFKNIIRNKQSANTQMAAEAEAKYNAANPLDTAKLNALRAEAAQAKKLYEKYSKSSIHSGTAKHYRDKMNAANYTANQIQSNYDAGLKAAREKYNPNAIQFSNEEAAILGLQSGEGIYNVGADVIKTAAADKEKLISRDEQARQAALAALAGLDKSNQLDTNLKYSNADKAGTQSAYDALDLAGTRANINAAEENFQKMAEGTNVTGYGNKKNKTNGKRYYAEETANLGNVLKNAGYDFDKPATQRIGNSKVLDALAGNTNKVGMPGDPKGVAGAMDGMLSPAFNMGDGQSLGQNALDYYGSMSGLSAITGALGMGSFGNAIGGALGFGGANTRESKADAALFARQDLEKRLQDTLNAQGFQNRVAVENNTATNSRLQGLQQLLANLDKTNRQG